jgi:hypothetical protein
MCEEPPLNNRLGHYFHEEWKRVAAGLANTIKLEMARHMNWFVQLNELTQKLSNHFLASVREISSRIDEADRNLKITVDVLAENGWYLSSNMTRSESIEIGELFKAGKCDEANDWMVNWFREHERDIEKTLCSQFKIRAAIIKSAFSAHRKAKYELSIPVMLAQADGACRELTGFMLFSRKNGARARATFAAKFASDAFLSSILEPLRLMTPLSANTRKLPSLSGVLNRHGILHGVITDYPSKVNSFKTISLLQYVADFVADAARS